MMPRHEPPRNLPDQVIRDSLKNAANLRDFLHEVVPHLAAGFVYERAETIEREFPWEDWRNREADLPLEIPYRTAEGEGTALVCVLIEHQSDTDTMMPLRALYFGVGYWDRHLKSWVAQKPPRPPIKLPPVVPIILYTGPTPWGSNRTMADLLGEPKAFHAFAPKWEPIFWNLADYTPRQLLDSGAPRLQMLSVIRVEHAATADFQAVFAESVRRLADLQGDEEVRWSDLLRAVATYASWRRPAAERDSLKNIALDLNPTRKERVRSMFQTIADELIERGRAEALAEVQRNTDELIEKGRAEGHAEGELKTARDDLRRLLLHKFQQLPDSVVQRIEACVEVERLKTALEHVLDWQSVDDFDL
jgi:hypothetical protein